MAAGNTGLIALDQGCAGLGELGHEPLDPPAGGDSPEMGQHARTAIGVTTLPLNLPVIAAAEI